MDILLKTKAEQFAKEATNLSSFSGINLNGIKSSLQNMLGQIGRDGIFDEYTKHDITHVDTMLGMLDDLIPKSTQTIMTCADWLLIVLSFYFHDLGMLVTKKEFKDRENNDIFKNYYKSYLSKVSNVESLKQYSEEEKERFIYQEFVRHNHGNRIADWLNKDNVELYDEDVVNLVQKMVSGLKPIFIRDVAKICKSHNEDDINDFGKYPIKMDYGMGAQEKGNVFYAVLMLRTADLLHITENRCPSEEFQIISPSNPISQIEWAKQSRVTSISPKEKVDEEGNVLSGQQSDTLMVTGYFEDPKGFFPLMDYLVYARQQLQQSYKLNEEVKKKFSVSYDFPWKDIDDSKVDTKEYERHQLSFTIDQQKILDLLVGETLYNNITVSIREIAQNAIDAVKVKQYELEEKKITTFQPKVEVTWIPETRQLIVADNGTGMDMDIINNHLLKVGSSRYRDKDFIKAHANFNSISRFGIGLLSCFLVAEDVDILTNMDPSSKPLLLKVSKLHGKYLLKHGQEQDSPLNLLDKSSTGTSIMLKILPDIDFNPEKILHDWILFPNCQFKYKTGKTVKTIGFKDTASMIRDALQFRGLSDDGENYKIIGQNEEGLDFSILLKKDRYLKDWSFVEYSEIIRNDETDVIPCGLSVEGIRIDSNTPGFKMRYIMAIVNLSGKNAPQTNVARSAINSQTLDKTLLRIYRTYLSEIDLQLSTLSREYSMTWASAELPYMLGKFSRENSSGGRDRLASKSLFNEALLNQKFFLIEKDGERSFCSIDELRNYGHFWMIDSAAYNSANSLIREVKSSNLSVIELLKTLYGSDSAMLKDVDILLSNRKFFTNMEDILKNSFEVSDIRVFEEHRCLNLQWKQRNPLELRWIAIDGQQSSRRYYHEDHPVIYIQNGEVNITTTDYEAIRSDYGLFIVKGSIMHSYLIRLLSDLDRNEEYNNYAIQAVCSYLSTRFGVINKDINWSRSFDDFLSRTYSANFITKFKEIIDISELVDICSRAKFTLYDKYFWYREGFNSMYI